MKEVLIQEIPYNLGRNKLVLFEYKGEGDPVQSIDKEIDLYTRGGIDNYEEFIDSDMDNPWKRIIMMYNRQSVPMSPNMEESLNKIKNDISPYKGTLVIDNNRICLLVDVVYHETDPNDFYWEYIKDYNKQYYSSAVGRFIPLKGVLPENDYNSIKNQWNASSKFKAI